MSLLRTEKNFVNSLLLQQGTNIDFLSELLPLQTINEEKQLSIYLGNVNGAHQKVLGQIYPACSNILGEEYFNQLCRAYRFEYRSINSDLNKFGEHFPIFVNAQIEIHDELSGYEYLCDLAVLEWHLHTCNFSSNDHGFPFEKLAMVKPEQQDHVSFTLSVSFSLHSSLYPVLEIWQANKNLADENQEFFLPEEPVYFCISRVDFFPVIEVLSLEQYKLLTMISDDLPLAELAATCNSGLENHLMSFIQKGWVIDFDQQN